MKNTKLEYLGWISIHPPYNGNCTLAQAQPITFKVTHQVNWPPPVLNCRDSDYFRIKSAVAVGFLCWVMHFTAKTQP